ncbi:hypothetical protein ABW19_dt0201353 [Dactylella cylindrospora]|nr:hypothetical protein ABW19_dt0201353 [Dactylella cylindrospora]
MSDQTPRNHNDQNTPQLPPPRGFPIPNAPVNRNPNAGRIGPIVNLPIPKNLDGKRDHSRNPNLDLTHLAPRGSLNTSAPPTEGHGVSNPSVELSREPRTAGGSKDKGKGKAAEEEEEEEEPEDLLNEDDDSDFEILDHPIMTPPDSPQSEEEAYAAQEALAVKVPPELVPPILDYAEYFPHEVIGKREEQESVGNDGSKVYLTARIPEFEALDKNTAGKGGKEGMGGRPGRVRKLVFKIRSKDQGWSSYPRDKGTYRGSWSWLEVELWRKFDSTGSTDTSGESSTGNQQQEQQQQQPLPQLSEEEKKQNPGMYRVTTCLLQRNKHAVSDYTDHEIVWDWKVDELDDEVEEKWEPGCVDTWQKGGRIDNGKFVRELRGGDELRVVMRALFPGWRCSVESCEIECWWAV